MYTQIANREPNLTRLLVLYPLTYTFILPKSLNDFKTQYLLAFKDGFIIHSQLCSSFGTSTVRIKTPLTPFWLPPRYQPIWKTIYRLEALDPSIPEMQDLI